MKILMYNLDKDFFEYDLDSKRRMADYGRLAESLDIISITGDRGYQERILGGNVRAIATNSRNRFFYIFDALRLGSRLIRKNGIDLIVTQDATWVGLIGLILSKVHRTKLLVSVYGSNVFDAHWLGEKWYNIILRYTGWLVLSQATAVQVDGFETQKDLEKRFGQKVFWKPIVPQYLEDYRNIAKDPKGEELRILFIARLAEQKNIRLLAEVIKGVYSQGLAKPVSFTIVGDGPLSGFLKEEVLKNGLSDRVRLVGRCRQEDLLGFYRSHDLLILTSLYEGFPRVFMEAAAIGLPIVTTRVSGVSNVIRDGESGYVIEQGDTASFVGKLSQLIGDRETLEAFSNKIKKDFWDNYTYETTIRIQKEIFDYVKSKG